MSHSTLDFDRSNNDFLINGKSLLLHLEKHEGVKSKNHISSIVSQPGACDRLLGLGEPDLQDGHVAIYLCSHCGGYDGNPIGVKLVVQNDSVVWTDIGYHYDSPDAPPRSFRKVNMYSFDLTQYKNILEKLKKHEP